MKPEISKTVGVALLLLFVTATAYGISSVSNGFQAGWFLGDISNTTVNGSSVSSLISSLQGNDTGVINAANYATLSDALNATPSGGRLYVPEGTYPVVNLNVSKYIYIYGDGEGSRLTDYTSGTSAVITSNHYITMENLGIETGSNVTGITVDSLLLTNGTINNNYRNIRFFGNGYSNYGMVYLGDASHTATTHELNSLYFGGYNTSLSVTRSFIRGTNIIMEEGSTGLWTYSAWVVLDTPWFETLTTGINSTCGGDITVIQPKLVSVTNTFLEDASCGYRTNLNVIGGDEPLVIPRWDNADGFSISLNGSIFYNNTAGLFQFKDSNGWTDLTQTVVKEKFTGNGATKNFTTTYNILVNSTAVYDNGVYLVESIGYNATTYSVNLTTAPGNGNYLLVEYIKNS